MTKAAGGPIDVTPSASRLTGSLRDIGYDFVDAVADLVDNSISAGAKRIDVVIEFDGPASRVLIADDGGGMTAAQLNEALRFGTRRTYDHDDLGKYGLGLKTASLSQCRRVTVATRRSEKVRRISFKTLDLDHIEATDRWEVIDPPIDCHAFRTLEWLSDRPGTVVLWEQLDRLLPEGRPDGGWAKRRLGALARKAEEHLSMVFHRFLSGLHSSEPPLTITVNGDKVRPWDPFAIHEPATVALPAVEFEVQEGGVSGLVRLERFVLPPRSRFSSPDEFERLSGPRKWNRQQGLYVYRAGRLVQSGGWSGLRAADEHTKLARAAVHFETSLDDLFRINVAKMRVSLPSQIKGMLERPVNELCRLADGAYRRDGAKKAAPDDGGAGARMSGSWAEVGSALVAAAVSAGEFEALERIMSALQPLAPEIADGLGWRN